MHCPLTVRYTYYMLTTHSRISWVIRCPLMKLYINMCAPLVLCKWFIAQFKQSAFCVGSSHYRAVANGLKSTDVLLNNSMIDFSTKTENLGVTWDCGLKIMLIRFAVLANSSSSLYIPTIYTYKHMLPPVINWNLRQSLVLCYIDYCNTYLKKKLQVL